MKKAKIIVSGETTEFPVVESSTGEESIDIRTLRKNTGLTTFDPGFANTAACRSEITYLNGEEGVLRYRGYPVKNLVESCDFVEVAHLLVHGHLPDVQERKDYARLLNGHSLLHEDMITFFRNYPEHAHPMAILSAMVVSLSTFYPELEDDKPQRSLNIATARLLSKLRTIAAYSYRKFAGEPFVSPRRELSYCENFLNMMFSSPVSDYHLDPVLVRAMNKLLIMHADHEQNCSTSAVRLVGSAGANLYASVTAGICALWGPRHGGANQAVIGMLARIQKDGGDVSKTIEKAKNKNSQFRLMGFGHRVYRTYDPRAIIAKELCREVLDHLSISEPLLDLALELEEAATADPYFQERGLYPNVDFYTGLIFRAMGIPTNMFTVMFAIGRLPGWIANWIEWKNDRHNKIGRPRQVYAGPEYREVIPIEQR